MAYKYAVLCNVTIIHEIYLLFNTHTRIADERFVFGLRVESILFTIDAIEALLRFAIWCNASIKSSSSEMLV